MRETASIERFYLFFGHIPLEHLLTNYTSAGNERRAY